MCFGITAFADEIDLTGKESIVEENQSNVITQSDVIVGTKKLDGKYWGVNIPVRVSYRITYTFEYDEPDYCRINYVNIEVTNVTVNGLAANVESYSYCVFGDGAYRIVKVNDEKYVRIDFYVDEYGEVYYDVYEYSV